MTSLRESKKAATRSALARAAAELVLRDGAEGLTVPAITAAAGVSPRTFHNYFASREDALVDFITGRVAELVVDFESLPAELDLLTAVERIVSQNLRTGDLELDSFPTLFKLCEVVESLAPQHSACVTQPILDPMIVSFRERTEGLSDFQLSTLVRIIAAAMGTALEWHYRSPEPRDPVEGEKLLREAVELIRPV